MGCRQVVWGRCRDDARNVLVAMMAELGAEYLYFAIQVLHNACPAKGYTAHVLGYTLHAILETISKVPYAHHVMHNQQRTCPFFRATSLGWLVPTVLMWCEIPCPIVTGRWS